MNSADIPSRSDESPDPAVPGAPFPAEEFTVDADGVAADVTVPLGARALVILAHGAGSDRTSVVLRTVGDALLRRRLAVALIDLPYRQQRPTGPPSPSKAAADRDGIRAAVAALRHVANGPVIVGGHSYGGRQASMVAAEGDVAGTDARGIDAAGDHPVDGLLLTSYPLHPPGRPERARTEHLPRITVPTLIVHGRSDAFGTSAEFAQALDLFGGPVRLVEVDKADHSLKPERSGVGDLTGDAVDDWLLPQIEEHP